MTANTRPEYEQGSNKFGQEIVPDAGFQNKAWKEVKPSAQWAGQWLGFKMIIKCGCIPPNFIAANFYQAGADHDPENEPSEQYNDNKGWRPFWKRSNVQQRTKKDCQKTCFKKLNFPSVAIPILPDMNEGHIEKPKDCQQDCICKARQQHTGKCKADPRSSQENPVRMIEPKK